MTKIKIFDKVRVSEALFRQSITHLISIGDPGESRPNGDSFAKVLRLEFHDIEQPEPGCVTPHLSDVLQALKFADLAKQADGNLAVHCTGGISRSTAIALCILADRLGDPELALQQLLAVAPDAQPNELIVQMIEDWVPGFQGFTARVRAHNLTFVEPL